MTTTPPAPQISPHAGGSPCPRCEVLISPMPSDARSVTVWRQWSGQQAVVRGASGNDVAGDFLVIDFEVPVGVPVTYTCQTADASGAVSAVSAPSAPVTLSVPDVWLMDPLDPGSATPVAVQARAGAVVSKQPSFTQLTYASDLTMTPVIGQDLPVATGSARRQAADIPVRLWAASDQADQLRALIMQALHLCLRVPAGKVRPLPPLTYLVAGDITESYAPAPLDRSIWTFTATSVQGPGLDVVVPTRTLDDLGAEASTLDGLGQLYATLVDLQRGH